MLKLYIFVPFTQDPFLQKAVSFETELILSFVPQKKKISPRHFLWQAYIDNKRSA